MTANMTNFEFGDIVLVPFPFTDQSHSKKRPAVIVSTPVYNEGRLDVILLAITGRVRVGNPVGEMLIEQWQAAGLLKPSVIKPIIFTLEKALIIKKMGVLSSLDRDHLRLVLRTIIAV